MDEKEWLVWCDANERLWGVQRSESPCRDCLPLFHADMVAGGQCDGTPLPGERTSGQPSDGMKTRPRYSTVTSQPKIGSALMTLTQEDAVLGTMRYCARCHEWWPQDSEFWIVQVRRVGMRNTSRGHVYTLLHDVTGYTCRACRREQQTAYARRRRAAA
jgi:hypothetical protein